MIARRQSWFTRPLEGVDNEIVFSILGNCAVYLADMPGEEQKLPRSNRGMADDEIATIGPDSLGCPLDPVLSLLALKWLVHVVWFLGQNEALRFAELRRQLP